jgi:hypothetical protein
MVEEINYLVSLLGRILGGRQILYHVFQIFLLGFRLLYYRHFDLLQDLFRCRLRLECTSDAHTVRKRVGDENSL